MGARARLQAPGRRVTAPWAARAAPERWRVPPEPAAPEPAAAPGGAQTRGLAARGIAQLVAGMGTSLTAEQANLIARYTARAFLLYDSDTAGLRATFRSADALLRAGVHLVLSGHKHVPYAWRLEHLFVVTTGTVSSLRLRGNTRPCYNVVEVHGNHVSISRRHPFHGEERIIQFSSETFEYEKYTGRIEREVTTRG